MSSSPGSPSPPSSPLSVNSGNGSNGSNASDSDENSLFVSDNDFHGSADGHEEPRPWLPGGNDSGEDSGNDAEELGADENQELDLDDDNSSEVDPEILNDMSDDDEDNQGSSSSRHAPKSMSKPKGCARCLLIKTQWNKEVEALNQKLAEKDRVHNAKIRELKEEIERLKSDRRIKWDPWADRLGTFLDEFPLGDPNPQDPAYLERYIKIYRDSCRQGIMSVDTNITHPDLSLDTRVYTPAKIRRYFEVQRFRDRYGLTFRNILHGVNRHFGPIFSPMTFTRLRPLRLLTNAPFAFEDLPLDIRCRIWKLVIPNSELVHCLSRLDQNNPPIDFIPGEVSYPSRFHIGREPCSVAKAEKPSRFLNYFLVSRKWYYMLAHLFYASNTFAFSSLGEFGRFCGGIGQARVERLVNVELLWQGSLTPQQENKISLRKQPLHWLLHTHCLRTFVVHINESERTYMRRPYEMKDSADYDKDFVDKDQFDEKDLDVFGLEVRRTDLQPNYRKNRSLRTVQGMDFVYQLRGMKWVRFYDVNARRARTKIRDWSFFQDINNQVTQKKSDSMIFKSEIENLPPLTGQGDFQPDDETMELIKNFYDDTPVESAPVGGSDTSSDSSARSTVSGDSWDTGPDDDFEDSPCHSPRSPSGIHNPRVAKKVEVIELDSDVEMDDNADDLSGINGMQSSEIDMSDINSSSGCPSHSLFDRSNDSGRNSGLNTTVTPQPQAIVIEDDDIIVIPDHDHNNHNHNEHRRRFHGHASSTDGYLFVPTGSCSAPTHNNLSSDEEVSTVSRQRSGRLFVPTGSCSAPTDITLTSDEEVPIGNRQLPGPFARFIDLTLNDDDDGAMDVDEPNGDNDESNVDEEIKLYNDPADNDGNDDANKAIKLEKPSSRGPLVTESVKEPSEPRDPDLDDDMSISIRSDPFDTESVSKCSSKRSRDEDGSD
ncbi:hypothetical protein HD806DRAFT_241983 [Xylariaceae sp. AK1471]|nr:hypothetical protein HD806DRAFT_241983 [Xylariaceae sp. AK1471]